VLELLIVLALLGTAALFVLGPLRSGREAQGEERRAAEAADLERARESKYREIRELELDWRTGKLSEEDYRAQDRTLRGEAIDILRALDRLGGGEPGS
jgi:hypothetical protein